VVRAWIGPTVLAANGARLRREVALAPAWQRKNLALAAFVQDQRTGRVLQAVAGRCAGSI